MGNGWSLGFSSIESYTVNEYYYTEGRQRLITSNGNQYSIEFTSDTTDSNLENYKLKDMRLENNGNGYSGASYTLFHADGKKEYFDANGRNIAIVDKYGNVITINYTLTNNRVSKIQITDTLGHLIVYQNLNLNSSVTLTENKKSYNEEWTLTLDGSLIKSYYIYNATLSGFSYSQLQQVKNENNEFNQYSYGHGKYAFNCFVPSASTNDAYNMYVFMQTVTYANGRKIFVSPAKLLRRLGYTGYESYARTGTINEYYPSDPKDYSEYKRYSYGDYTRLNTEPGDSIWYDSYDYSTAVTAYRFKNFDGDLGSWQQQKTEYKFNAECLKTTESVYNTETHQDDLMLTLDDLPDPTWVLSQQTQYAYDDHDLPTNITATEYTSAGTIGMTTNALYTYDSKGNRLTQSVPNNNGGTYQTTYTYDDIYNMPLTVSYNQDASKPILLTNTLTSDGKSIANTVITATSEQKARTDYTYNSKGQVVDEKDYSDASNYVEKQYAYGTDVTPQAQITEAKVLGVKDTDGTLVTGTTGYDAGILVTKNSYDTRGRVVTQSDASGNESMIGYDLSGRIISVTNPDDSRNSYVYDLTQDGYDTVTYTNELGTPIKYTYDKFGNEISTYDVTAGKTLTSKRYDSFNRLIEQISYSSNGENTTTYYYYDADNRIIEKGTQNASGTITSKETYSYTYTGGLLKTTKTVLGDSNASSVVTTSYTNNLDNVVKTGRILNGTEYYDTYTYDNVGNKISEKTAIAYAEYPSVSYTTKWEYDYAGNAVKTTNVYGDYSTQQYDWLGRLTSAADYVSNSQATPYYSTYNYDAMNRLLQESTPFEKSGTTIYEAVKTYAYDNSNNLIASTVATNKPGENAAESTTYYSYNNRNQMTGTQIGSDYTAYTYDSVGNPLTITTANGAAVTEYAYDHMGRPIALTDALGQEETYTYDQNGNLLTKTDRNGNVTAYTYDDLGRPVTVSVTSPDGTLLNAQSTAYTLTGQVQSEQNDTDTITRSYDALGRMTQEIENGTTVKNYAYNLANLRTAYTLTVSGTQELSTAYTYDELNRLLTVLEDGVQTASYAYDKNGNRSSMTNANGTTVAYTYNPANLVTSLQNKKGTSILSSYNYTYYLDGNQANKADNTGRITNYSYDTLRRMTQEAESGSTDAITKDYTFDAASNRATMTVSGADSYTTSYTYDLNNRLLKELKDADSTAQETQYFYDPNGNTIAKNTETLSASSGDEAVSLVQNSDGAELYTYDGFNRLTQVENGNGISTYDYRPDGLRNSKTVNGVTTTHIWDGQDMSAELDNSGALLRKYIRGTSLVASEDAAGTRQYDLYNAHGDVVQLTDSTGGVTKSYAYDAFGNEKNPDSNDTNPFRYCGEYFDQETGDVYLRARYYEPESGRFTQQDTIRSQKVQLPNQQQTDDPLSLNLYTYCYNNPIMYFDSTGNQPEWSASINAKTRETDAYTSFLASTQKGDLQDFYDYWGFFRDSNGVYHSQKYSWQSRDLVGYCDEYDQVFDLVSDMQTVSYTFSTYNQDFVLWCWKGDYYNLGAGAEAGIYYGGGPKWKTGTEFCMPMKLSVFYKGPGKKVQQIVDWNPDDTQWWITGFNPYYQNVQASQLTAYATIDFSDHSALWDAFYEKFGYRKDWNFNEEEQRATIKW